MFIIPPEFTELMSTFSSTFSRKIYRRAIILLLGAILTQGKRTICAVLRTLNLSQTKRWDLYHRVLSRAKWSAFRCAQLLAKLLIRRFFANTDTLTFGIDETVERRWGSKIKARGIYRDAVRSSKSHFVKCSGLRWICLMLLTPITWAQRIWALPFLTVLAPSERYHQQKGKKHKKLSDWAYQIALLIARWFADFNCIVVADGSYAIMELLDRVRHLQTWIVRFRLDAALYDFPPVYSAGARPQGRPAVKGERQPSLAQRYVDENTVWQQVTFSSWYGESNKEMLITSGCSIWYRGGKPAVPIKWVLLKDPTGKLDPAVIASTNLQMDSSSIVKHFVQRWCVEVTFEEVRTHLGVETQRQWSDKSIERTTPILMALFSLITLWADTLHQQAKLFTKATAWYQKKYPTFSDALYSVRRRIWLYQFNLQSAQNNDRQNIKQFIIRHLAFMAARTA